MNFCVCVVFGLLELVIRQSWVNNGQLLLVMVLVEGVMLLMWIIFIFGLFIVLDSVVVLSFLGFSVMFFCSLVVLMYRCGVVIGWVLWLNSSLCRLNFMLLVGLVMVYRLIGLFLLFIWFQLVILLQQMLCICDSVRLFIGLDGCVIIIRLFYVIGVKVRLVFCGLLLVLCVVLARFVVLVCMVFRFEVVLNVCSLMWLWLVFCQVCVILVIMLCVMVMLLCQISELFVFGVDFLWVDLLLELCVLVSMGVVVMRQVLIRVIGSRWIRWMDMMMSYFG